MDENNKKILILDDEFIQAVSSDQFSKLPNETRKFFLNSIGSADNKEESGGIMGKFFGYKKEDAAMNIAFMVCVLLTVVGIICMAMGNEQWNIIITGIMTTVGYIFGRGSKD